MNCRRETMKMGVPPGSRPAVPRDWSRGVPEWYVAGADTRGHQEGWPYPWSQSRQGVNSLNIRARVSTYEDPREDGPAIQLAGKGNF